MRSRIDKFILTMERYKVIEVRLYFNKKPRRKMIFEAYKNVPDKLCEQIKKRHGASTVTLISYLCRVSC